jgi:hypothetical protein
MDLEELAMAVPPRLDLAAWRSGFDEVFARVAGRFAQAASQRRARAYLLGLLSRIERKNGWTIAELAGMARRMGCSGCCVSPGFVETRFYLLADLVVV